MKGFSMYKYNLSSEQLSDGAFKDISLVEDYHYIKIGATTVKQLAQSGIFPQKKYTSLYSNKPDGIILQGKNNVKVLIEAKPIGVISDENDGKKVLTDWYFKLAQKLNCNLLCAKDSEKSYWFDSKGHLIKNADGSVFVLNMDIQDDSSAEQKESLVRILKTLENIDDNAKIIPEKILNPTNLANRVWQKIWINTGKDPEKCLYNVVEMFIFKFLSDLNVLTGDLSFSKIYDLSTSDSEQALSHYARMIRPKIREMFPKGEDGTTIINGTIFVNEKGEPNHTQKNLFKEVIKEFFDYGQEFGSFKNIDKQFKTRLYESFLRQSAGIASLGQYFTPRNVVKSIINMIPESTVKEDMKVCDPFCGVGGFPLEFINSFSKVKNQFKPCNGIITPHIEILGYDKGSDEKDDERTIILAKANMLIYLSDLIVNHTNCQKEFSEKVFNKTFHLIRNNLGTFSKRQKDYFDLILTNPPYVTNGVSSIKKVINDEGLSDIYPSNGNGLEGLAIEWIIYSLKPGGRAFIVVPDGLFTRSSDKALRDRIIQKCDINAIISLPSRTFFATSKKTYILAITKKDSPKSQTIPVFTYLVSNIGETKDANRIEIAENDLSKMSLLYKQFSVSPSDFKTDDRRCKIQEIDRFKDSLWLVDKDWSDDEIKELGISEDNTELSETEFYDLISDIKNKLSSFLEVKNV